MNLNFNVQEGINRFSRLGTWYILALSAIATVAIIGQVLIQNHLANQQNDAHVVNVAGKQRMLSQQISKSLLKLSPAQFTSDRRIVLNNLRQSLELWKLSQEGLLHGNDSLNLGGSNSPEVSALFKKLTPHFNIMAEHATKVVALISRDIDLPYDSVRASVETVRRRGGSQGGKAKLYGILAARCFHCRDITGNIFRFPANNYTCEQDN